MTAREFINMLETFMPDLDVPLICKLSDTGEPCQIWAAGGNSQITLYIKKKNRNEPHP